MRGAGLRARPSFNKLPPPCWGKMKAASTRSAFTVTRARTAWERDKPCCSAQRSTLLAISGLSRTGSVDPPILRRRGS